MNRKKVKQLIENIEKLYNLNRLEKIAKKHLFVKRRGKVSAKGFLNICTFMGEDLCSAPLSLLCAKLEASEKISISPHALSKRFNKEAVNFIKSIFYETLNIQNETLKNNEKLLKSNFNRITIVDSTGFKLDDKHENDCNGSDIRSSVKIQLQYDLLTGEFIHCELKEGSSVDASYLETLQNTVEKGDLSLKDLGYFKARDLNFIDEKAIEQNKWWLGLNCYMTNVPKEVLTKEMIHDIYSLRWQIELMFKIWKSLIKIHEVKKAGLERIQCFIYGILIMLLLTSSIVFTARNTSYIEGGKDLIELKSFGVVQQYFNELHKNIFKGKMVFFEIFQRIVMSIEKYDIKSKRKGRKTTFLILKITKISESVLLKMAI